MMATKKETKAAEVLANRRTAFAKRVRSLLGHVSGRIASAEIEAAFAKADQNSYGEAADALAAEIASREPVGRVIHALKFEAVEHAEQKAREVVESVRKELEEGGWDINAVAPYPYGLPSGSLAYDQARAKYGLFHELAAADPAKGYQSSQRGQPRIVVMDEDMIERFVDHRRRMAALQYDAFIVKMVAKVGEVTSAELEGSHVWSHSFLIVEKPSGREVWKTQQIVNHTKYGRPYYQWPSRIVKERH